MCLSILCYHESLTSSHLYFFVSFILCFFYCCNYSVLSFFLYDIHFFLGISILRLESIFYGNILILFCNLLSKNMFTELTKLYINDNWHNWHLHLFFYLLFFHFIIIDLDGKCILINPNLLFITFYFLFSFRFYLAIVHFFHKIVDFKYLFIFQFHFPFDLIDPILDYCQHSFF